MFVTVYEKKNSCISSVISENPIFGHVCPVKIQISLRMRALWSESLLGAVSTAKYAKFLPADNEDCGQTTRMRRLILVFVGRTSAGNFSHDEAHFVSVDLPYEYQQQYLRVI